LLFKHRSKAGGHFLLITHSIHGTDYAQLDTASEWLDEITHEIGTVPAKSVDDSD
jgi:hypothetical protein